MLTMYVFMLFQSIYIVYTHAQQIHSYVNIRIRICLKYKRLPWTVDHLARGSMKNAANCASTCELQDTWTSTFRTHIAVLGFCSRTTPGWGSYQFQRLLGFLFREKMSERVGCSRRVAEMLRGILKRESGEILLASSYSYSLWLAMHSLSFSLFLYWLREFVCVRACVYEK